MHFNSVSFNYHYMLSVRAHPLNDSLFYPSDFPHLPHLHSFRTRPVSPRLRVRRFLGRPAKQ
jgi:hypothetical protein